MCPNSWVNTIKYIIKNDLKSPANMDISPKK